MDLQTEVLIIGGGATGAGISRDLALRGIPSLLVEKDDFTSGASGRNQGLLHSGARYAVNDLEAARECISENRILRRIAPHCIENTDGLFVSLPEDGAEYRATFIRACAEAGIDTLPLSPRETLSMEPKLNPRLIGAVQVPDGAIDPFTLVVENARDAESRGARFLLHTEVTDLIRDGLRIAGARVKDRITGKEFTIAAPWVINATGAWVNHILAFAGLKIGMALSKGSMLITNTRLSERVINRCRPPASGDIIVPNDTVSILGTTSQRLEDLEHYEVTPEEVSFLVEELSNLIPALKGERFTRAYAGVRPLVQAAGVHDDREISRGFALIDHESSDGLKGLVTITGGKLMTYRLMAERTTDFICARLGLHVPCITHAQPLPGAGRGHTLKDRLLRLRHHIPAPGGTSLRLRAGSPGSRGCDPPRGKGTGAPGYPPPHPSGQRDLPGGLLRLPPPRRSERNEERDGARRFQPRPDGFSRGEMERDPSRPLGNLPEGRGTDRIHLQRVVQSRPGGDKSGDRR